MTNENIGTHKTLIFMGSCCGSAGRAVASDSRDLHFKCSHWQNFILKKEFTVNCQKKRPELAHLQTKLILIFPTKFKILHVYLDQIQKEFVTMLIKL